MTRSVKNSGEICDTGRCLLCHGFGCNHELCCAQAPLQPKDYGGTSRFGGPPPPDSLSASSASAMAPMSWDPAGMYMPAGTEPAKQPPDALHLPPLPGMQQAVRAFHAS